MLPSVTQTVFLLFLANYGHGSLVGSSVCTSYRAVQDLSCIGQMVTLSTEELGLIFHNGNLTQEGIEVFLNSWCRGQGLNAQCIAENTQQCTNVQDLEPLRHHNGGICTEDGQVDPQVLPFVAIFSRMSWSDDCIRLRNTDFGSCYTAGSSERPNRPDRALTIPQGIEWWTRDRTVTVNCIANKTIAPPPSRCGSVRDLKIFEIIDAVVSEPYGIGAHVDISHLVNRL